MHGHGRDRFAADELAIVLSHYDLGVIESVTEFRRGSRRSAKVGIVAERGKFLLKKRDRSRGGAERVNFAHAIQAHLAERSFPLPRLISPRNHGGTLLAHGGGHYELFEYVSGHPYTGSAGETRDAGRTLGLFHEAVEDFPLASAFGGGGYHEATAVQTGLNAIPAGISSHDSAAGRDAEVLGLTSFLFDAYTDASQAVEHAGFEDWPDTVAHGDWHPGNCLFKVGRVLAVIDYDCAKIGKAMCDLANGVLQFSMVAGGAPQTWPDHLDMARIHEFVGGYESVGGLPERQMRALPHLMIEALVAESVLPIAATGSFGPHDGFGFLRMVRRKVAWIQQHMGTLQDVRNQPASRT